MPTEKRMKCLRLSLQFNNRTHLINTQKCFFPPIFTLFRPLTVPVSLVVVFLPKIMCMNKNPNLHQVSQVNKTIFFGGQHKEPSQHQKGAGTDKGRSGGARKPCRAGSRAPLLSSLLSGKKGFL